MWKQRCDKYYEHIPESVINVNGTTIMWDVPVITDQAVLVNQPDIFLHDRKKKTYPLIDIAMLGDSNVNTEATEKLSNYEGLEIVASRMHKVRSQLFQL
jgi:hypothetical protein